GAKLNFKGQYYRFDLMTPFFNPGAIEHPNVPVYVAAVNQAMCRVAGEVCDGLHVHPFNSPRYLREFVQPAVKEGLAKAGRDWKGMADLITDEMVETYAVTGTYADIGHKIRERYTGLLDRTAFYQPYTQPSLDDPRIPRLVKEFNG